jgi:hypothetical protein
MRSKWIALVLLPSALVSSQYARPHLRFSAGSNGFVAFGRWTPSDPKDHDFSPSETEIECEHQSRSCAEATAKYFAGTPHVSLEYFEVAKWDENGIIATSSSKVCMTETILISFSDESISSTHAMKKLDSDTQQTCKIVGATEPYTELSIVENSERWNADPYGSSIK